MNAATIHEALSAANIQLRRLTPGTHRTACPRCKKGPRDDAMAVTIHNADDVVWVCHRCHWADGWWLKELWEQRKKSVGNDFPPKKIGYKSPPTNKGFAAETAEATGPSKRHSISEQIAGRKLRPVTPDNLGGQYFANRFCPLPSNNVWFTPAEWHPFERQCFPCVMSIVTDIITGEPISLHQTFLDPDGSGKAKIERPRLYLAGYPKAGGVVRLHADDEVTQGLIIGEGLETCLSYALEFSPVWACLDAGNLAAFPVLPGIEGLTVLVDNDDAGRHAFDAVCGRYEAAGIDVIGIRAAGKPGADINDMVTA